MPNIIVKIPKGSFPGESRAALAKNITQAATSAEQIPANPMMQVYCSVLIEEVESGSWTCGGLDITAKLLLCFAVVYVPSGVLDETSRRVYVELMHAAFKEAMPGSEKRDIATSIVLQDVPDGTWGAGGVIWKLPDFAKASGYAHLQNLSEAI